MRFRRQHYAEDIAPGDRLFAMVPEAAAFSKGVALNNDAQAATPLENGASVGIASVFSRGMFIERRLNATTGTVELWKCDWENAPDALARKVTIERIGEERKAVADDPSLILTRASAICWSYGRTLGNLAVFDQSMLGAFRNDVGEDAVLPCDIVEAGKFRHGPPRWWCRTHQVHWGTKADLASFDVTGQMLCANHAQKMSYVVSPFTVDLTKFAEVGVWCSMPAALSTWAIRSRPPRIHVHVRKNAGGTKEVDRDFHAIALDYQPSLGMFEANVTRVNITPPAAFEFVNALESGRELDCIDCNYCGYPHLDLGSFAAKPHKKHFCANCGRDSIISSKKIISTPLKRVHDAFMNAVGFEVPARKINLDDYSNCNYALWSSTPAIVWTATRPQQKGIHVHVHAPSGERIIDDTYGEVLLGGRPLIREDLLTMMVERTIV